MSSSPRIGMLDVLKGGNTVPPSYVKHLSVDIVITCRKTARTADLAIFVHNWRTFHNKSLSQSRCFSCTFVRIKTSLRIRF